MERDYGPLNRQIRADQAKRILAALDGPWRSVLIEIARADGPSADDEMIPAIPPGGPLPKQGGAEAPLEFD